MVSHLGELGITSRAQPFVRGLLRGRSIRVRLGTFPSKKRMLSNGLPEFCGLSPPLFNVALSNIVFLPVDLSREIQMTAFADDIFLWTPARFNKNLKQCFQAGPRLHHFQSRFR